MTEREEQIAAILEVMDGSRDPQMSTQKRIAERLYDAGARIPAPPPAPTVVVSEEAAKTFWDNYDRGPNTTRNALRAAFPLLLRDNPDMVMAEAKRINPMLIWLDHPSTDSLKEAVNAAIRERVAKLPNRTWLHRGDTLTALGVTP